jgi:hypothetical protein
VAIQTVLDRDTFGLFGLYDEQASVGTAPGVATVASGTETSLGVNFNWTRSLTPEFTSASTLGYDRLITTGQKTFTIDWKLTYIINDKLQAILHYSLINVSGTTANTLLISPLTTGNYTTNLIEIGVTRSF